MHLKNHKIIWHTQQCSKGSHRARVNFDFFEVKDGEFAWNFHGAIPPPPMPLNFYGDPLPEASCTMWKHANIPCSEWEVARFCEVTKRVTRWQFDINKMHACSTFSWVQMFLPLLESNTSAFLLDGENGKNIKCHKCVCWSVCVSHQWASDITFLVCRRIG